MAKTKRSTTRNMAKTAPQPGGNIRCAMTSNQYEGICQQLCELEGMLELVQAPDGTEFLGLQVGLHIIRKKVKSAQGLMQAAWDRTREAREAA